MRSSAARDFLSLGESIREGVGAFLTFVVGKTTSNFPAFGLGPVRFILGCFFSSFSFFSLSLTTHFALRLNPDVCPATQRFIRSIHHTARPVNLNRVRVDIRLIGLDRQNRVIAPSFAVGLDDVLVDVNDRLH